MPDAAIQVVQTEKEYLAFTGLQLKNVLSAELFLAMTETTSFQERKTVAGPCHDRWVDLAAAVAGLPEPAEFLIVAGAPDRGGQHYDLHSPFFAFLAMGRGDSEQAASKAAVRAGASLRTLVTTTLDYAGFRAADKTLLARAVSLVRSPNVTELRRRLERVRFSSGVLERRPTGFLRRVDGNEANRSSQSKAGDAGSAVHLFPWVPSDDSWYRLMETLAVEEQATGLVVHCVGMQRAPEVCKRMAREGLASAQGPGRPDQVLENGMSKQHMHEADALAREALHRVTALEAPVLAACTFVVSDGPVSPALVATVQGALDDASVQQGQAGAHLLFKGGSVSNPAAPEDVLDSLEEPGFDVLFSPREAASFLRTPMPCAEDLPGVAINRARTGRMVGSAGNDCSIGFNRHRGRGLPVALDDEVRFKHTYVVGQTGTGKSTLLLNMALHDIRAGRGVAVLDPHGSLIDDILARFPEERKDDAVIVDVTDVERPVGFNLLKIDAADPLEYRRMRDIIIDDLLAFLKRHYNMEHAGGPVFETHFRGMLSLLIGLDPPDDSLIPNLAVFRSLYTNEDLLTRLASRVEGKDFVIDDFVKEIRAARGDWSLSNMATYITSKLNLFVFDVALRCITCQNNVLDIDSIVNEGKVLLFYLGKGRFGEEPAGLLASQIVSRIRYAVMKRGASANHRPFYLYADEFHMFADKRFGEMLAEARKFGLSLTLAHQYAEQIPDDVLKAVLGNVGTMAVARVGAQDAGKLESLFLPYFSKADLSSLPNYKAYVRSFGTLGTVPFSVDLAPPPPPGNAQLAKDIRELSRRKYGRDREEVEEEVRLTYECFKDGCTFS